MKEFHYFRDRGETNIKTSILRTHGFFDSNSINSRVNESMYFDETLNMKLVTSFMMGMVDPDFYNNTYDVVDLGKKLMRVRNDLMCAAAEAALDVLQNGEAEQRVCDVLNKMYNTPKELAIPYGDKKSSVLYINYDYDNLVHVNGEYRLKGRTSLMISDELPNISNETLLSVYHVFVLDSETRPAEDVLKEKVREHFTKFCQDLIHKCSDITKFIPGSCEFADANDGGIGVTDHFPFRPNDNFEHFSPYIDVIGNAVIPCFDHNEMTRCLNALISTDSSDVENELFNLQLMGFSKWDILVFMLYGNVPYIEEFYQSSSFSSMNFSVNYWMTSSSGLA